MDAGQKGVCDMTTDDKIELALRIDLLGYWAGLGYRKAIEAGVMSQRDALAELREMDDEHV